MSAVADSPRYAYGRSLALACLSGLLLALSMPGLVGWWWLGSVALVPLLFLCRRLSPARAALAGLFASLLHHLLLLYWIIIVLGHHGGLPIVLATAALVLLALYMSLYGALWAAFVAWAWRQPHPRAGTVVFWMAPLGWAGLEWVRGWFGSGLPWMDLGYLLAGQPQLLQAADLGGHLLLGSLLMLANMLLATGLESRFRSPGIGGGPGRLSRIAAVCVLLAWAGYGLLRLPSVERLSSAASSTPVTVVQGNIAQELKWSPQLQEDTLRRYEELSMVPLAEDSLVIWPETALPFVPDRSPLFWRVLELSASARCWLMTGAPTEEPVPDGGPPRYFNSALLVSPDGILHGVRHKRHLVPFGEYIPLRSLLFFLAPVVETLGDFTPGRVQSPLEAGARRLGVLICYESIFPDIARRWVADGANLLVNLTNDAWYGRSSAPWHSQSMAILRAVETRRALARAANTGVSGFVTPSGRVLAATPLFVEDVVSARLPLLEIRTVFLAWGYRYGAGALLTTCAAFSWLRWSTSRRRGRFHSAASSG